MVEQQLNRPHIGPGFEKMDDETVRQTMWGDRFGEAGPAARPMARLPQQRRVRSGGQPITRQFLSRADRLFFISDFVSAAIHPDALTGPAMPARPARRRLPIGSRHG